MRLHLLAVGTRMPAWVDEAWESYARRLPPECSLVLREITLPRRTRNMPVERLRELESQALMDAMPGGSWMVALDERGKGLDSQSLSRRLGDWMQSGRDVSLLVGGPDGLADACRQRADLLWSLSPLTFPHPLVRVILAEQIYRAWSLLRGHPYHRGE